MRTVQSSLNQEKRQIFGGLKEISRTTEALREESIQRRRLLSNIKSEVTVLEQSVAVAEAKIEERDKALAREKSRVATLELFVKSSCKRQEKKADAVHLKQLEAVSKIEEVRKSVRETAKESQLVSTAAFSSLLNTSTETLEAIREIKSVDPTQLTQIDTSIQELHLQ
jgi:hypothetical protein